MPLSRHSNTKTVTCYDALCNAITKAAFTGEGHARDDASDSATDCGISRIFRRSIAHLTFFLNPDMCGIHAWYLCRVVEADSMPRLVFCCGSAAMQRQVVHTSFSFCASKYLSELAYIAYKVLITHIQQSGNGNWEYESRVARFHDAVRCSSSPDSGVCDLRSTAERWMV